MIDEELQQTFRQRIVPYLTAEDDANFWETAFDTLLSDMDAIHPDRSVKHEIFLQIGACSHWVRPHQTRWTAAGGFAWPEGYIQKYRDHWRNSRGPIGHGLPELDWFVLAHWYHKESRWRMVEPKFYGKKKLVLRASLPTRTTRHPQAAIHTIWSPGTPGSPDTQETMFYGFRKRNQEWKCVAVRNWADEMAGVTAR
jgi:hypothetical protein